MKMYILGVLTLSIIITSGTSFGINNETADWKEIEDLSKNHESNVLSRRKRFIVFPDGSSFQLVFCTQTHGYLQVGDIVWFGSTAALAWELPSDPSIFDMFREKSKLYEGNRRSDEKHILYVNEYGKIIGKVPYHRKPIVNPAFAKRSVDPIGGTKVLSKKKMHDMQKNANYLNSLHEKSIEFHRSGRKSLYVKVEKVLQALGWNGRECVLRMLCESSREKKEQGSFLEEIVRATFSCIDHLQCTWNSLHASVFLNTYNTRLFKKNVNRYFLNNRASFSTTSLLSNRLPKGREFEVDHHKLYDQASGSLGHCSVLYPGCKDLHGLQLYNQLASK